MLSSYLQGLGLSAGLIIAIGAQNAHVLRTGLLRRHVGLTVTICILIDVLLISAGIAGMGALIEHSPLLLGLVRWGGVIFLALYGLRAFKQAWAGASLRLEADAAVVPVRQALAAVLAVSLLNPHLYLDTMVLLGSLGGRQVGDGKLWFGAGAISASMLWFPSLGFGARLLTPWFAKPVAWRVLDVGVGTVMASMAGMLALSGV